MSAEAVRRSQAIIAAVAWFVGLAGFSVSIGVPVNSPGGAYIGALLRLNQLGALAAGVLASIALIGIAVRVGELVVGAGTVFAAVAVIQLVQLGARTNWFGGNASTVCFFLTIAVGLLVLAFPPAQPEVG